VSCKSVASQREQPRIGQPIMAVSLFHHPPAFTPLAETASGLLVPASSAAAGSTHASTSSSASGRQQCTGLRPSAGGLPSGGVGKRSQSRRGLSKFFSKARSFASFDEATLCAMCDGKSTSRVLAKQQHGGQTPESSCSTSTSTSVSTTVSAPSSPMQSHRLRRPNNTYHPNWARPNRTSSDTVAVQRAAAGLFDDESVSEGRENSLMAVCFALERACVSEEGEAPLSASALTKHSDWTSVNSTWGSLFHPPLSVWSSKGVSSDKGTSMEVECT
jgi:hypothetical protein